MLDLSIIIVSYKSKDHLAVLLPSIFASQTKYSFEVIVVDNDSRDGTAEFIEEQIKRLRIANYELPADTHNLRLSLIRNINNGFSAGNNKGIKQASGKYILLLNPDTKVAADTFEIMLNFMEQRQDVGISGCKLVMGNGKLDLAHRRRFPNPVNSFRRLFLLDRKNYNYFGVDENFSMEVDSVVGAFLLIRKSLIEKIGLLDEKFFMYGEDLDWCWRCKAAGFKVWYYPKTTVLHFKGQSSKKARFKTLKAFHDAMWIFYKKHYAKKYFYLPDPFIFAGIYLRLAALAAINIFKRSE